MELNKNTNIFVNKNQMIGNCYNNILQDYYTPKRALIKNGDVNASKNRKFAENNGQYESEK